MSVRVLSAVWDRSKHKGTHLLMLLALADFSDDQGSSYPAVPTLAAKCRMSTRNAGYLLTELQASGELEVRPNEGPRGTNRYRIVLEALEPLKPIAGVGQPKGVKPASGVGVKPTSGVKAAAPLQPTSDTPAMGFREPLQPTADEPSLNRQEPSVRVRARRKSKTDLPADFVISERVKTWAAGKGYRDLEQHLEAFKSKAIAKGYTYVDWDEAFMGAIRDDWAKLRTGAGRRPVLDADDVFAGAR